MGKKEIYSSLIGAGMTPQGACAMLGNMMAESALRANNAQDGMTSMSDEAYTAAVDNGTYQKFVKDAVGYGLCQWTFFSRKGALLEYAKSRGKSIGDEQMQTEFCIKELKSDYLPLWNSLCKTDDLYNATARICTEYERPAVNNISARYSFAQQLFAELTTAPTAEELAEIEALNQSSNSQAGNISNTNAPASNPLKGKLTNETVLHLQVLLKTYGYDFGTIDGIIGNKTKAALKAFTADFCEV